MSVIMNIKMFVVSIIIAVIFIQLIALTRSQSRAEAQTPSSPIAIDIPDIIRKENDVTFVFHFTDYSKPPVDVVPLSVRYRIDDINTKQILLPWVTVAVEDLAAVIDRVIPKTVNKIVKVKGPFDYELHVVTVEFTWLDNGYTKTSTGKAVFKVGDNVFYK